MIKKETNQEKMNEILNSEFINDILAQEDKDLAEAGWTYTEVKSVAAIVQKAWDMKGQASELSETYSNCCGADASCFSEELCSDCGEWAEFE